MEDAGVELRFLDFASNSSESSPLLMVKRQVRLCQTAGRWALYARNVFLGTNLMEVENFHWRVAACLFRVRFWVSCSPEPNEIGGDLRGSSELVSISRQAASDRSHQPVWLPEPWRATPHA